MTPEHADTPNLIRVLDGYRRTIGFETEEHIRANPSKYVLHMSKNGRGDTIKYVYLAEACRARNEWYESGAKVPRIAPSKAWSGSAIATASARYQAEREHRENEAAGVHSESEWQAVLDKFGRKCLRCGIPESETRFKKLTKDHIVPLASGGTQYASNLQPLCSSCNSWKHNREIDFRPVLA